MERNESESKESEESDEEKSEPVESDEESSNGLFMRMKRQRTEKMFNEQVEEKEQLGSKEPKELAEELKPTEERDIEETGDMEEVEENEDCEFSKEDQQKDEHDQEEGNEDDENENDDYREEIENSQEEKDDKESVAVRISKACQDVILKKRSFRGASEHYKVPYTTLHRRVENRNVSKPPGRQKYLAEAEEKMFVSYAIFRTIRGCLLSRQELLNAIQSSLNKAGRKTQFDKNLPSVKWFDRFQKRHKLSLRKAEDLEGGRTRVSRKFLLIKKYNNKCST